MVDEQGRQNWKHRNSKRIEIKGNERNDGIESWTWLRILYSELSINSKINMLFQLFGVSNILFLQVPPEHSRSRLHSGCHSDTHSGRLSDCFFLRRRHSHGEYLTRRNWRDDERTFGCG